MEAPASFINEGPTSKSFLEAIKGGNALKAGGSENHPLKSFKDVVAGEYSEVGEINYTTGEVQGHPALLISEEDILSLAKPFKLTLIGKFASKRPSISAIRKFILRLKFLGLVRVYHYDDFNVIFRFSDDSDYNRFFSHRYYNVFGIEMKIIKWSPFTDVSEELPIVPLWICFPGLRYQFFNKTVLFKLAKIFGSPLCVDSSTAGLVNMSKARVLVEIDVSKSHPDKIWIGSQNSGAFQQVIIENKPSYCEKCKVFGHASEKCVERCLRLSSVFGNPEEVEGQVTTMDGKLCILGVQSSPRTLTRSMSKVSEEISSGVGGGDLGELPWVLVKRGKSKSNKAFELIAIEAITNPSSVNG